MQGKLAGDLHRRVVIILALMAAAACGAADEPVDPGDLALRDLLGVAPKVASHWDADQRAAAREVLASGLRERAEPIGVMTGALDEAGAIRALAAADVLLDADEDALGLVVVERGGGARAIEAPIAIATLRDGGSGAARIAVELDPQAWPCAAEPDCDLGVLTDLAADAAPDAARVRVVPVVQLTVIAARVTGADGTPTLLVNPIVTAVGEPAAIAPGVAGGAGATVASAGPAAAPMIALPLVTNRWSYDGSLQNCVSGVTGDCADCLAGGVCDPIWSGMTGLEACQLLDANPRNYELLCANLAVSLSDIAACVADHGASCPIDANAIASAGELDANARFLDDPACQNALSVCLTQLYGGGGGSDDDGCGACDGCDCDGCDNDNDNMSCNDNDQSMDNCNGCNNGGNGCNNGDGGGCNNNGGGGSCTVARRPTRGGGLAVGLLWALLPIPAGLLARRRARRRAARGPDEREPADPA